MAKNTSAKPSLLTRAAAALKEPKKALDAAVKAAQDFVASAGSGEAAATRTPRSRRVEAAKGSRRKSPAGTSPAKKTAARTGTAKKSPAKKSAAKKRTTKKKNAAKKKR